MNNINTEENNVYYSNIVAGVKFKNISNFEEIYRYNKYKPNILEQIMNIFVNIDDYKCRINYTILVMNKNISVKFLYENYSLFSKGVIDMAVYNCNIPINFIIKNIFIKHTILNYNVENNNSTTNNSINHRYSCYGNIDAVKKGNETQNIITKNSIALAKNKYTLSENINLYNKENLELEQETPIQPHKYKTIENLIFNSKDNYTNGIYSLFNLDGLANNITLTTNIITNNISNISIHNLLQNKAIVTDNFELIKLIFINDMAMISANHNITPNMINSNPELNWRYDLLHNSLFITEEFIEKNINKNWNWDALSKNSNISFEFIIKYNNKKWNWSHISKRITFDKVINNLNINWQWDSITINPNITLETIFNNPNLPWQYELICENPNLTFNNIITIINSEKYNNYLNMEFICSNEFMYNPIVCKNNMENDISNNKKSISNILTNYVNNHIIKNILIYTHYN